MGDKGLTYFYDSKFIYELALKYEIDPGFVLATFIWETGWGEKSRPWLEGYNPAGITCGGSYCLYDTAEQGMEEMFKLLRAYADGSVDYIGKRNTLSQVRGRWSESEDSQEILDLWRAIYD